MIQEALHFDGITYSAQHDQARLGKQLLAVRAVMQTGRWMTYSEIADLAGVSLLSVGSRVRDLRKPQFGNHDIPRRRRGDPKRGIWEYRMAS